MHVIRRISVVGLGLTVVGTIGFAACAGSGNDLPTAP
jgi:hypothetical protein